MTKFQQPGYLIDRRKPSALFLETINIAGQRIHEQFGKNVSNLPPNLDYKWIRRDLTYPAFDHLSFAYKNQVFSVLAAPCVENESLLTRQERSRFIDAATKNNLVPCLFKIDIKKRKPLQDGWNLTHFTTGEAIVPAELASNEKILLSEWELHNFAIQIVRNHITDTQNGCILSYCDVPDINPQLWFEHDNGDTCWVIVRHIADPDNFTLSDWLGLEQSNPQIQGYDGYFAAVSFASAEPELCNTDGNTIPISERFSGETLFFKAHFPLYRTENFHVKFDGLQQVYTC